jgi:hypothetical protein
VLAVPAGRALPAAESGLPPGVYHRASGAKLSLAPRPTGPEVFKVGGDAGLEVRIVDKGGDCVEIYRNGTLIHEHLINAGRTSKIKTECKWREVSEGQGFNVVLRYGDQLDLYICYAIRAKDVIHSELLQFKYQDDFVDRDYSFEMLMNSRIKIGFGNALDAIIDWDPGPRVWQARVARHF